MKKVTFMMLILCFVYSCKEDERGQYALDAVPPGEINSPVVKNIPGGAIISYTIPNDGDLLYVKAIYTLDNGVKMEQKASAYARSIKIEGLGKSQMHMVSIFTGDRSKNESKPVQVEIYPEDSPIYNIFNSVKIQNDFGGIQLDWENPLEAEVALTVLSLNNENKFVETEIFYTSAKIGKGNLRGLPSIETIFAVYVSDRWDNRTDTISGKYFPIFEEILDMAKFVKWNPTSIPYEQLSQVYSIEKMWDKSVATFYSLPLTAVFPYSVTMDLGQAAKLNRFKIFQRGGTQLYMGSNVKRFQLWGSDNSYANVDFSTWIKLGDFQSIKPSGSPLGVVTGDDQAYALKGEDYAIDLSSPVVRYLRFVIQETWGASPAAQIAELEFYGVPQK